MRSIRWWVWIAEKLNLVVVVILVEPCQQAADKVQILIYLVSEANASKNVKVSAKEGWDVWDFVVVWEGKAYMQLLAPFRGSSIRWLIGESEGGCWLGERSGTQRDEFKFGEGTFSEGAGGRDMVAD